MNTEISPQARLQLWIAASAFFMEMLDATIVNTALPAMAHSLGVHPMQMHSVVLGYVLTVAIMLPASGWIADRVGVQRTLLTAIVLFALGSLCAAMSHSLPMLVASRVLQGIGGAMMVPVGRLAVLKVVPRSQFMAAMNLVTIPGLVGPLLGPTLGGFLVEYATWHWIFLINLPVALVGFVAVWKRMPNYQMPPRPFDVRGFLLMAVCMASLTLALEGASAKPLHQTLWMLAAGLLFGLGYWLHARWRDQALFSLRLFRIRIFSLGIWGNLAARIGTGALPVLTPLFMQLGLGLSPLQSGLAMIPLVMGSMGMKTLVVRTVSRLGYRTVLVYATLGLAVDTLAFPLVGLNAGFGWLIPQLVLLGMLNAVRFSAMNALTLKDLPDDLASSGNSLLSMVMQLSMSLGVSFIGMVLAGYGHPAAGSPEIGQVFTYTYAWLALMTALPAVIFLRVPRKSVEMAATAHRDKPSGLR